MPDSTQPPTDRLAPIPTFLPARQVHLLSGPPGGGKTTLLAGWTRAFRDGAPIFGRLTNRLPWIGTLIADREARDTLSWYATAGCADIPHYSLLDSGADIDKIRRPIAAHGLLKEIVSSLSIPPNGLLILDPIAPWCGGDLNKYHVVYPAMILLGRLCLDREITILGLAHTGKQKADAKDRYQRPQDRILGSTALLGCSGTQMALVPPEEDSDDAYTFTWVPHHAKAESFELSRGADGLFLLSAFQQVGAGAIPHPEVLECIPATESGIHLKMLIRLLSAKQIFLSRPTLFRVLATYLKLLIVDSPAKGLYRRLPYALKGGNNETL